MRKARIRGFVGGVLAVSLLIAGQAEAGQRCSVHSEQAVFDLQALKSELMVLATACHSDVQYNAFVNRFKPSLAENEHELSEYFKHTYGRRSQGEQDSYITTMANEQFNFGLKQGTDFCPRNMALFDEVMAVETPAELPLYAAAKELFPPTLNACAAPVIAVAERSTKTTTRHAQK